MKLTLKDMAIAVGIVLFCIFAYHGLVRIYTTDDEATDEATTSVEVGKEAHFTLEKMYDAIRFVESTDGERIYGENGEIGDYQLKKIYIDDVNRIQRLLGYDGEEPYMSYDDRYGTVKSRRATAILTSHYANATWKDKPHTALQYIETAARAHHRPADRNNSKTDAYWAKILARMENDHE